MPKAKDRSPQPGEKEPYEKPRAIFIAIKPEERLMSCPKISCGQPRFS